MWHRSGVQFDPPEHTTGLTNHGWAAWKRAHDAAPPPKPPMTPGHITDDAFRSTQHKHFTNTKKNGILFHLFVCKKFSRRSVVFAVYLAII